MVKAERLTERVGDKILRVGIIDSPLSARAAVGLWIKRATEKLFAYGEGEEKGRVVKPVYCAECALWNSEACPMTCWGDDGELINFADQEGYCSQGDPEEGRNNV